MNFPERFIQRQNNSVGGSVGGTPSDGKQTSRQNWLNVAQINEE